MYRTAKGEEIFVIDGHTHFWDGSPANQKNIHGKQFIECFYAYHTGLSPKEQLWEKSKFEKYSADDLYRHAEDLIQQQLARQSPMATDLRFLLSVMRIVPAVSGASRRRRLSASASRRPHP